MLFFQLFYLATSVSAATTFAGVNIAGFDFGVDTTGTAQLKGVDPPLKQFGGVDGAGQMQHFVKTDGFNLFRLPVSWQFLINNNNTVSDESSNRTCGCNSKPGNTLDTTNFQNYDALVQECLATGAHCIIDIHNYARFNGLIIGQGGPTNSQFASLWSQIATKYANQSSIIFGIMNEPHSIPNLNTWRSTVQSAVTAIRFSGATSQTILLPGTGFSSAQSIMNGSLHSVTNPDGSTTNLVFDVHQYLDKGGAGQGSECVSSHVEETWIPLAAFLRENKRMAIVSETGGGDTESCYINLCAELAFLNANKDVFLGYAGWSAGSFSTEYSLAETPVVNRDGERSFSDRQIVKRCVAGTRGKQRGSIGRRNRRVLREMIRGSSV